MSNTIPTTACLSRRLIRPHATTFSRNIRPCCQIRTAVHSANAAKYKRDDGSAKKKKKAGNTAFKQSDLKFAIQFPLVDAMRYIRAFEVGRGPMASKYELAVKLRTMKNGPVVRNRFRLPHPVSTSSRFCVIADPESKAGQAAKANGAVLVGEDDVFEMIKDGKIEFDKCLCHSGSLDKLNKSGVGRVLGPRGLMPSTKNGTVVNDVAASMREGMVGGEYRERSGVVRLAIGQLGYTPEELQANIRTAMDSIKQDCSRLQDKITKEVHEVVLSSTNSPGFSLSGEFRSEESLPTASLSTS